MQIARRLYVYLLTGIGLGVLVSGISLLLTTLFEALGLGGGLALGGNDRALRERLTLATAMTVVALPVWLIHWLAAERSVRPGRPGADVERSSGVRGLFFALVLGILLLVGVAAARALIEAGGMALAGEGPDFRNPAGDLALFFSAGAAWIYHVGVRTRDWSHGPITGPGAWLPRAYLYLAVFIGLFVMLFGIRDLLDLAGRAIVGDPEVSFGGEPGAWWAFPLTSSVGAIVTGGLVWIGHWWYAARLRASPGPRGASERSSRVRLAFFVGVLVLAAGAGIGYLSEATRAVLEALTGVSEASGAGMVTTAIVSLVSAGLFGLTWWIDAAWLRLEAAMPDAAVKPDAARWLECYSLALVGLGFGTAGVVELVGLLLDVLLGGGQTFAGGDVWRRELAGFLPFAVFGSALWLWQWSRVTRDWSLDPVEEAASTVRRAALLIVLAVSILSGIVALGIILYRVFGTLFGLDVPGDVVAELSTPIAAVLVAVLVAGYHGAALRRDQALHRPEAADVAPAPPARSAMTLRLTAPVEATPDDVAAVTDALRQALPPGYALEDDGRMT